MAIERFPQLVVVGSSAGGIEALTILLASLPKDGFAAPIVIAQHIDPSRPSHLGEILARRSSLPVRTIDGSADLEPGVVFVVPANRHVAIADHVVTLREDRQLGPKPSVDLLLSSAAQAYGEGLVAVILSGTGSDGAAGAHYVKQQGGTVIIENPETAHYPGMPQSLSPATVDIVANLDKIGPLLHDLLTGAYVPTRPDTEQALDAFLNELKERSGIDFNSYKRPTIQRRLRRRLVASGTSNLEEYLAYIQAQPEEYQRLVNSFLIKVTEFFRDADLFAYLRAEVLPGIVARAGASGDEIRVWSAGCATGEEAYSLAILLSEALGPDLEHGRVRIFATDLDNEAVSFGRRGIYPAAALENLDPSLIERYFTNENGQYEIKKRVRALTVFGQHDLAQRAPFPRIDLILCRNVLIYFTTELQKRALQLFAFSLRDGGYLALGKAETTGPLGDSFAVEEPSLKIYRRQGDRMLIPPLRIKESRPDVSPLMANTRRLPSGRDLAQRPSPPAPSAAERLEDLFLRLPVGIVIVDQQYDIQSINGVARRLLAIHGTAIGDDFVHLAQILPPRPLREAIDGAFRQHMTGSLREVEIAGEGTAEVRWLDVDCWPQISDPSAPPRLATIVVADVTERVRQRRALEESIRVAAVESKQQAEQLERVLESNRGLLEANDELTTVNMELRGANEEFLVDNEEVQAATEEVETLNEELQATNEELETLNEELQATVEELNTTNDDLQARSVELQDLAATREEQRHAMEQEKARLEVILASMGAALLVVDARGHPLLTNAAYRRLLGADRAELVAEDRDGGLLPDHRMPQRRAAAGESFLMEFVMRDAAGARRWFEAEGSPLRDGSSDGAEAEPAGGVIVIRDVTDRSMRQLQDQWTAMASHELRTPLTSLQGFVEMLNRSLRDEPADSPRPRYAELALQQARRLGFLINDLLDLSRVQSGRLRLHRESVNVGDLVKDTADIVQALAPGRTIDMRLPSRPIVAELDRGRIEQVVINLVNNAVAHTKPDNRVALHLRQACDQLELKVEDEGPGIPESELPNIFTRFYQVERGATNQPAGMGLGLFIVREFAEAHGGRVTVESKLGQGTTFTVVLPLHPPAD